MAKIQHNLLYGGDLEISRALDLHKSLQKTKRIDEIYLIHYWLRYWSWGMVIDSLDEQIKATLLQEAEKTLKSLLLSFSVTKGRWLMIESNELIFCSIKPIVDNLFLSSADRSIVIVYFSLIYNKKVLEWV